jgi:hypothetical protein
MPQARASDMAMHAFTVGTRAKPIRREIEKVREVGALRKRLSERPAHVPCLRQASAPARIFAYGLHVARRVSRHARRPRQPNQHFFVAALGDARTLARVSRAHSRNSGARDYGPSRPCTGYGVTCACELRTACAEWGRPLHILLLKHASP